MTDAAASTGDPRGGAAPDPERHVTAAEMHDALDRAASTAEEDRIFVHLADCAPCRDRFAAWLLPELLGAVDAASPGETDVLPALAAGAIPSRRAIPRRRATLAWAAAAAALILASIALWGQAPVPIGGGGAPTDRPSASEASSASSARVVALTVTRERVRPDGRVRETWTLRDDGAIERSAQVIATVSGDVAATVIRTGRRLTAPAALGPSR